MRINILFTQENIITDYQDVTEYQFLVDKKLGVCRQEVNSLLTNS
jgi:hypothetical protein